ncbi:MAG: DNA polymerase III subunit gamma/tau [Dehalococcoidales bacterium]
MASQVFYRKWRPQTLADLVGQEHVTRTILNALKTERLSHAYLFCGPRGTGKTSTGRILAKAVNCLTNKGKAEPCNECAICQAITEGRSLDVIEIDAASNTGVDDIRALREKVNYAPAQAEYKIYIIDEVHMLSTNAANALLKTLEEPPPRVIFVLATTEAHKVLPTTISRCQRFDFHRLSQQDIESKLSRITKAEGIKIQPQALRLITRSAGGSLRDAENLLEQLTTYYGSSVKLKQAQEMLGITGDKRAGEMVGHIMANDITAGMRVLNAVTNDGLDLKQFNRELVAYLRQLLLVKAGSEEAGDFTAEELAVLKDIASRADMEQILKTVKAFGRLELGFDGSYSLPLELALVEAAELPTVQTPRQDTKCQQAKPVEPSPLADKPKVTRPKDSKPEEKQPPPPPKQSVAKPEAAKTPTQPPASNALPATPAATPPATEAAGIESKLDELQRNWRSVIEKAPQSTRRTAALAILRSAGVTPIAIKNGVVILAFKYTYHKEKIDEPENKRVTAEILSNFLGRPCQVECVFEPEDNHLVREAQRRGAQIIKVEEK